MMMMMDNSAMDSVSEHSSNASSSGSPAAVAIKPPISPANNNNPASSNHNQMQQQQASSPRQASPLGPPPMSLPPHPLSPPPVSTPNNSLAARGGMSLAHLPPPGLGLLNSLGVLHNPLDLMAHHGPPRSYNSPPPISTSDPTANECKLVDYRGQKVAAFIIAGDTMLCLPQAFELFLKHLVGGLHTVYTKLKRLDIVPLVCNVEQVRILRGLGAIQPGVNRCKLLSCKDFDTLYRDCTTASSRPGRPPKRAPVGLSLAASHLHHQQQIKKHRLDNGDYPPYENGHMADWQDYLVHSNTILRNDMPRMEKSPLLANGYNHPPHLGHMQFMQLPAHPAAAHSALLSPGMPHGLARPDGSVIKNQAMPSMEAIARSGIWENCRAAYEDIVKHLERLREERGETDRALALDHKVRDLSSSHNGSPNGHSPVLNLSKSGAGMNDRADRSSIADDHSGSEGDGADEPMEPPTPHSTPEEDEEDNLSDPDDEDEKDQDLDDGVDLPMTAAPSSDTQQALNYSTLASAVASAGGGGGVGGGGGGGAMGPVDQQSLSSTETLLRNIQGLLKVAADNARQQERQINYEKAELKMDVLREREVKDSLERQLQDEQKIRVMMQKRLRKERRARRRLQEQLEMEMKRRVQLEEALKASGASVQALRILNETSSQEQHRPSVPSTGSSGSEAPVNREQSGSSDQRADTPPYASQVPRDPQPPPQDTKPWNYSGLDLMSSGAAFWQNYSESLAQELEMERKSRQQQAEKDVKSPLQDRSSYYKNSVLFTSAT